MGDFESNYYPPRARWYSPWLVRRALLWRKLIRPFPSLGLPPSVTFPGLIGGFFVPGLAFYLHGWRVVGRVALAVCALLLLLFIIFLGFPFSTYIFGALISIHTMGLITYCGPLFAGEEWPRRLLCSFSLYLAAIFLLYVPARSLVQNYLLVPLRMHGRVIVVRRTARADNVTRGSLIAFHLHSIYESGERAVYVRGGVGLGSVLAMPGDTVDFSPAHFSVNGETNAALPRMPESGQVIVPENCWFVWSGFATSGHGNIAASAISAVLLEEALVPKDQFFGKAFKRWFGRRQLAP